VTLRVEYGPARYVGGMATKLAIAEQSALSILLGSRRDTEVLTPVGRTASFRARR